MVKPSSWCENKVYVRKGMGGWAEEKDDAGSTINCLSSSKHMHTHTPSHWTSVPRSKTSSGPKKSCGKNCRLRWSNSNSNSNNNVRPPEGFTQQEEELIIKLHAAVGSRWGLIAHQLPGRTENDIKNHWNTKLRKKLTEMGIDPITHKPFSQILADYGNIGGISRSSDTPKYIGTITRDLKKVTSTTTFTSNNPPSNSTSPSYTFISNSQLLSHPMSMSSPVDIIHYANHTTTTHSLDLLSQLQAISLVTEGPNSDANLPPSYNTNDLLPSFSSTSPSSSSYNNINNSLQAGNSNSPDHGFSWHDFLLEEPFKPAPNQSPEQLGNNLMEFHNGGILCNDIQAASSTLPTPDASSFLEAMLDHEDDMFLTFPGLMEEPLY